MTGKGTENVVFCNPNSLAKWEYIARNCRSRISELPLTSKQPRFLQKECTRRMTSELSRSDRKYEHSGKFFYPAALSNFPSKALVKLQSMPLAAWGTDLLSARHGILLSPGSNFTQLNESIPVIDGWTHSPDTLFNLVNFQYFRENINKGY